MLGYHQFDKLKWLGSGKLCQPNSNTNHYWQYIYIQRISLGKYENLAHHVYDHAQIMSRCWAASPLEMAEKLHYSAMH